MMKRIFLVLLILVLVGALGWGGWRYYRYATRPTLERNGGTMLVYEVDVDKFPEGKTPAGFNAQELADAIRRRLDPSGEDNINVSPSGENRLEVTIPHRRARPDHVQNCKEMVAMIGSLEFRIVANQIDDKDAIEAAQVFFIKALMPESREARLLNEHTLNHTPPPPPSPDDGKNFTIKLNDNNYQHTYSWVELGRSERRTMKLDNASVETSDLGKTVLENLKRGEPFTILPFMQALLYVRKVQNVDALPEKDRDKQYEYFLLMRDPEPGSAVTGQYLVKVYSTESRGRPAVGFHFNQQGAALFGELTRRNQPEDHHHRYLGIMLDGRVESAPSLNAVITNDGIVEGQFSKEEIDRLVLILRAGQLPATLKPVPVSEATIDPISAK